MVELRDWSNGQVADSPENIVQLVGCRKLMLTAALVFCLVATCVGRVESVVIRAADRIAGVLTLEF